MRYRTAIIIALLFVLAACNPSDYIQPTATNSPQPTTAPTESTVSSPPDAELPTPTISRLLAPSVIKIKGKDKTVDLVVHGFLCDAAWSGTIYVADGIEVKGWVDQPTFLRDCDFSVEEGTVVYVARHNDAEFFKGCSCHQ